MNIMLHVEATHIPEEPARYTCHICGLVRHGGDSHNTTGIVGKVL